MEKKRLGFGARGWILCLYQFVAFLVYVIFTNWPMNALGDYYGGPGGTQNIAMIYTVASVLGVIIQVIAAPLIGKIKNIKLVSIIMGIISMLACLGVMLAKPGMVWKVFYFITCLFIIIWATFVVGILVGQWFPRRKGTVMGLVTISFPIANALMSPLLGKAIGMTHGGAPVQAIAPVLVSGYLPFFILGCVAIILAAILLKDYPEQCGAYRDNDRSITPEVAKAMMEFEIENKRTSVWGLKNTLKSPDFWLIALPMGFLLVGSVGMMTQTANLFVKFGISAQDPKFGIILMINAVFAIVGSYVLGLIDTKIGTRKSMIIAVSCMVISGILGAINTLGTNIAALWILGIFMGASSNYTVSGSVQYWRIEDFPTVFGKVNHLANLMNNCAPVVIANLIFANAAVNGGMPDAGPAYIFVGIIGAISVILLAIFKPGRIKSYDDKYRTAAGKPLDDALVGRK